MAAKSRQHTHHPTQTSEDYSTGSRVNSREGSREGGWVLKHAPWYWPTEKGDEPMAQAEGKTEATVKMEAVMVEGEGASEVAVMVEAVMVEGESQAKVTVMVVAVMVGA